MTVYEMGQVGWNAGVGEERGVSGGKGTGKGLWRSSEAGLGMI